MPFDDSEPEIIPPGQYSRREARAGLDDQTLKFIASLLDDIFRVPGTSFRFGLDPLIGLIPGLGDFVTSIASFLMVYAAWQRRMPKVTIARMVANIAIDTVVGTIPIAGDFFDAVWKSNRMNLALLQRSRAEDGGIRTFTDWLFMGVVVLILTGLALLPLVVIWLLIRAWHGHP